LILVRLTLDPHCLEPLQDQLVGLEVALVVLEGLA